MKWLSKIEIVLGVWILVSPWLLGYASISAALWSNIIGGALVALTGLWGIFGEPSKDEDKNKLINQ